MITIVSGFGRCGSSLCMQMLHYAGFDMGQQLWPMFEDGRATTHVRTAGEWIWEYNDKALKWLDPLDYPPPAGRTYRVIWMHRSPKEQAKSYHKYLARRAKLLKRPQDAITKAKRLNVMGRIKRDTKPAIRVWKQLGADVFEISYERILLDPLSASIRLADWLGIDDRGKIRKMSKAVESKYTRCKRDFLEDKLHREGPRA